MCSAGAVRRHAVVADVPAHDRAQPLAHLRDGIVHAPPQLGFHLAQLRLQPLANRLPQHREPSVAPLLPADMRKAEKVERLRFPFSALLPVLGRERSELQQSRLLGMQFQAELSQSLRSVPPRTARHPPSPGIPPRCRRRSARRSRRRALASDATLGPTGRTRNGDRCSPAAAMHCRPGRPFLRPYSFPVLQHAGVQPFLDEPHDAPVRNPVLDELHQPFVRKRIEKAANVHIEHPVHLPRQQSRVERIQRVDAGFAPAGTRTRNRGNPFRRWRSTPRPSRAGRFCLPAP